MRIVNRVVTKSHALHRWKNIQFSIKNPIKIMTQSISDDCIGLQAAGAVIQEISTEKKKKQNHITVRWFPPHGGLLSICNAV